MASILILFESKYGQTEKLADVVAEVARRRGHATTVARIEAAAKLEVADHDAVVVLSPIYNSRHPRVVEAYLHGRADVLAERPTLFVSVSNSAANADPIVRKAAEDRARAFVARAGLPDIEVATAGGALAYPRYGLVLRLVMRWIAKRAGEPVDTSRVHELTDFAALEEVAATFLDRFDAPAVAAESRLPPPAVVADEPSEPKAAPETSGVFHVAGGAVVKQG